jgi:hypothetical protein
MVQMFDDEQGDQISRTYFCTLGWWARWPDWPNFCT